jgi:hypothetical protein
MLTGETKNMYAERKKKKETQNGDPQTQKAIEKEPSQEKIIFNH